MALVKRTGDVPVEKDGKIVRLKMYEKKVVTTVIINRDTLEKRKAELETELQQINIDLAQIAQDEQLGDVVQ